MLISGQSEAQARAEGWEVWEVGGETPNVTHLSEGSHNKPRCVQFSAPHAEQKRTGRRSRDL